jgi:hypothetical protein
MLFFAAALAAITATAANSQTMSIVVDDQGVHTRAFSSVFGEPFDVVTLLDTGGVSATAAEWVQTELTDPPVGYFRLGTVRLGNPDCWWCDHPSENVDNFGQCYPGGEPLEVLRITYGNFQGTPANDIVLTLRGFQPGDSQPSSIDGHPGFLDCDFEAHPVTLSGGDAWETGAGVIVPSGALVLNPTPPLVVGGTPRALSHIKAVYR